MDDGALEGDKRRGHSKCAVSYIRLMCIETWIHLKVMGNKKW